MTELRHGRVVQELGRAIVSGKLQPDDSVTLDGIQDTFRVSRTVARDGMRVLQSLGLVHSSPRRGLVVQPMTNWNVFDPTLIMLRLDSPERDRQLRSLTELRRAVEPTAAMLAAVRASQDQRRELVELTHSIRAAGEAGNATAMMEFDVQYHELLLTASQNEMLQALKTAITSVLRGRAVLGLLPCPPAAIEVDLHDSIADAVRMGAPEQAMNDMTELLREVATSVSQTQLNDAINLA